MLPVSRNTDHFFKRLLNFGTNVGIVERQWFLENQFWENIKRFYHTIFDDIFLLHCHIVNLFNIDIFSIVIFHFHFLMILSCSKSIVALLFFL